MYLPKHFAEHDGSALCTLIAQHPLATLIVVQDAWPVANHIPLQVAAQDAHGPTRLHGHVARANPLWRALSGGVPALAIFHGPEGYVSPTLYPSKRSNGRVVPTWNYAVVHVHGRLRAIDDRAWLREQIEALTHRHEAARPEPWRPDDAPTDFLEAMLSAIVGIELAVERVEGKFKLSQNRSREDRAGVSTAYAGTPLGAALLTSERTPASD